MQPGATRCNPASRVWSLLLHVSSSQKLRLQNAHRAKPTAHADIRAVAPYRSNRLRRLEARHSRCGIPLRVALVDQQHIVARGEDVSARLVLGSIIALDERELAAGNLLHLLTRSYIPEAHLSERKCGVSTLARPAKLIIRLSTQDWHAGLARKICMPDGADKHRAVVAAADDLQAVVAELNALHV